jgi:phenylpyruvate tautomerase PptA (4-oxalocrotonate tautomerase family)
MSTFEATVVVQKDDITRALIKALSDAILYVNGTAPEGMWSACPVIIDDIERESCIISFSGDASEVTDVTLRIFGEERWEIHLSLDEARESFVASSTVTIAAE